MHMPQWFLATIRWMSIIILTAVTSWKKQNKKKNKKKNPAIMQLCWTCSTGDEWLGTKPRPLVLTVVMEWPCITFYCEQWMFGSERWMMICVVVCVYMYMYGTHMMTKVNQKVTKSIHRKCLLWAFSRGKNTCKYTVTVYMCMYLAT